MKEKLEALQTTYEYIGRLHPAAITCSENMRKGEVTVAYETIGAISEGLEWLINILGLTQDIHEIQVLELRTVIGEFIEALENEDTVMIADLLEYEIGEMLEKWYEALNATLDQYNEGSNEN